MLKNPEPRYSSAPAKLNLFLHVTGRSGAYHQIESLAVFTTLGDRLEVRESAALSLEVHGPFASESGANETNLVLRAADALAALAPEPMGAAIKLYKYLPVASGLGGGSSDAAAAIQLLIGLWDLQIEDKALSKLAMSLGADVPVCLHRRPCIMRGAGEQLFAAPSLPKCYVLLVNPRIALSTEAVFNNLNGRFGKAPQRFSQHVSSVKTLARLLNLRRNDLQTPAIELVPEIQTILDALSSQKGCLIARMSGSGATCFGLFANADEMGAAATAIKQAHPEYWLAQTRLA